MPRAQSTGLSLTGFSDPAFHSAIGLRSYQNSLLLPARRPLLIEGNIGRATTLYLRRLWRHDGSKQFSTSLRAISRRQQPGRR